MMEDGIMSVRCRACRLGNGVRNSLNDAFCARIHNRILPLPRGSYPGVRVNRYSQRHLPLPRGNYLYPYLGVGVTDIHNESLHRFGVGSYPAWGAG